jgi:hypothetical protein
MPRLNNVITIYVDASGTTKARMDFNDGSSATQTLVDSGSVFAVADSPAGDKYRVVSSTGDLQLIDNDGLIRVARRLENRPSSGECR